MLLETIKQGAAAVRRLPQQNPLTVLIELTQGDPSADADRLFRAWSARVREDDDLLTPALRHTFTNLLASIDRDRRNGAEPRRTMPARKVFGAAEIDVAHQRAAALILLNLTLPNGKLLRDATFADCLKAGGWLVKVGRKGKPRQIVGKVLGEDQLRAIWATAVGASIR